MRSSEAGLLSFDAVVPATGFSPIPASPIRAPERTVGRGDDAATPRVSVVVLAAGSNGVEPRELATIVAEGARQNAEVVIVVDRGSRLPAAVRDAACVRFVVASAAASTMECRRLGLEAAGGDVVMLVDEASPFARGRFERIVPVRRQCAD